MSVQKAEKIVPMPSLLFSDGELAGKVMRLDGDAVLIGRRADNNVVLRDPRVSRVHASVRRESGITILTDLGSVAGVTVNGTRVVGSKALHHGDAIQIGPIRIRFEDPATAVAPEDPTIVLELPRDAGQPHLSPRQGQVLTLMAEGMTNSEIGARLGVTERTVKAYAQELYDKLGVRNRAGAVAEAAKLDLL